ncbi:MAG: O-acetyl-ADP-ribose deacetylase [Alphaproteobacteria bacterium]|nr:O-acetyl-ADP-ribose deacetylase [Rhodospirillaceae bacterium]MBT6202730.1 O-acetyl-ADP-ribose deacetylase [Rhodospirillaceae bacterium]MBT6510253.1 O-acetyl-ADP-ribose deacetylase [Rhodospirillaceae bacterium]MDG2483005.1 O-acetyl-ADP-ribose deacetylase [Alphaproteobacteria bacterium]
MTAGDRIRLVDGDITTLDIDAIVNAANEALAGGGGVDGAIHRSAGPELMVACREIGGCPTGQAVITRGFNLKARHVIHTVGPAWRGGDEDRRLADCYRNSLMLAQRDDLATLAFPSISTGVYGFPIKRACRIAIREVIGHFSRHDTPHSVTFCCFGAPDTERYREALAEEGFFL